MKTTRLITPSSPRAVAAWYSCRPAAAKPQAVRALAYRLFAICERKGWAEEALAARRNRLVVSRPER